MFPDFLTLGPITLHTYGLMTVLGWFLGLVVMVKRREIAGLSRDQILDLSFVMILSAVAGARILYILVEWETYRENPVEVLMLWRGGLVFYGGFIGAVLALAWVLGRRGLSRAKFADMTAPALALGHGLGRVGCFLNGCCYGKTAQAWAVHFPRIGDAPEVRRIPLQLWEALFNVLLAAFLARLPASRMKPGRVFASYLAIYGGGRFILEGFRGDPRGNFLGLNLSTSQGISALVFLSALVLWFWPAERDAGAA